MHFKHVLAAAAVCTLYLGAATQPVNDPETLESRARFGGDDPEAPAPVRGDPGVPAAGPGAGKGSSNWGEEVTFQAPASFTKAAPNGKGSYLTQGQGVEADRAAASGPDAGVAAVADYPTNIKNYKVDEREVALWDQSWLVDLKGPLQDLRIDGSGDFSETTVKAGKQSNIHEGYYSGSSKTAIISDVDNGNYASSFKGNKVYQSQILFAAYSKVANGDVRSLQWVAQSQVVNPDTQGIIRDAQTATKGSIQQNTQVTFSASAAEGSAEKASFDALAGSDNGRMVFKMLTDNHEAMGGKTVVACHTWVLYNKGEISRYEMVWELSP